MVNVGADEFVTRTTGEDFRDGFAEIILESAEFGDVHDEVVEVGETMLEVVLELSGISSILSIFVVRVGRIVGIRSIRSRFVDDWFVVGSLRGGWGRSGGTGVIRRIGSVLGG